MPDIASDSGVTAPPPEEIVRNGQVIGHICGRNHQRIVHYAFDCPMCQIMQLLLNTQEHNERLMDEAHYRQSEFETARDRVLELEEGLEKIAEQIVSGGPDGF